MLRIVGWFQARAADLAFLAGCVSVAVGAGLVYLPAGFITGGAILTTGALLAGREDAPAPPGGGD